MSAVNDNLSRAATALRAYCLAVIEGYAYEIHAEFISQSHYDSQKDEADAIAKQFGYETYKAFITELKSRTSARFVYFSPFSVLN